MFNGVVGNWLALEDGQRGSVKRILRDRDHDSVIGCSEGNIDEIVYSLGSAGGEKNIVGSSRISITVYH
jgi:hypothetical protein